MIAQKILADAGPTCAISMTPAEVTTAASTP
jgi:hypothetical protein